MLGRPWLNIRSWAAITLCTQLAEAEPASAPKHYDLERTSTSFLVGESAVALGAWGAAWLVTWGPSDRCHWCRANSVDISIRNALRANNPGPPAFISHALSSAAVPVLGLTGLFVPAIRDDHLRRGFEDLWIVANTWAVTTAVGDLVKHLVARERPSFHYEVESQTEFSSWPSQRNKSFFSLDTAWAFAIASSSSTLAYLRGYSSAPYVAVGGGVLALGAGTLRIVGDAHWASDVVTGAVVGTGIGIALPLLLHGRRSERSTEATGSSTSSLSIAPTALGNGVSFAMVF